MLNSKLLTKLLVVTFLLVNFLFFIDEGYYDFRWMSMWGNWVVFVIYNVVIFSVFVFVIAFLNGIKQVITNLKFGNISKN